MFSITSVPQIGAFVRITLEISSFAAFSIEIETLGFEVKSLIVGHEILKWYDYKV